MEVFINRAKNIEGNGEKILLPTFLLVIKCSKTPLFSWSLNSYQTTPGCNDLGEDIPLENIVEKKKCCDPAFSSFPTMCSTSSKTNPIISASQNLLSVNAFSLPFSKL